MNLRNRLEKYIRNYGEKKLTFNCNNEINNDNIRKLTKVQNQYCAT